MTHSGAGLPPHHPDASLTPTATPPIERQAKIRERREKQRETARERERERKKSFFFLPFPSLPLRPVHRPPPRSSAVLGEGEGEGGAAGEGGGAVAAADREEMPPNPTGTEGEPGPAVEPAPAGAGAGAAPVVKKKRNLPGTPGESARSRGCFFPLGFRWWVLCFLLLRGVV